MREQRPRARRIATANGMAAANLHSKW